MKLGIFKRTAIVTALATAGLTAHAADGYSFYALVDGGIASTSVKGGPSSSSLGTTTEFVTGGYAPTFIGMKAEKSMDGMTGGFQLEQGFLLNPNQAASTTTTTSNWGFGATNSLFNRQANLFIKGTGGTLKVGTMDNIAFSTVLKVDPRAGSNFGSGLQYVSADGPLGTVDVGAINYTSPTVDGFTGSVSIVPDSLAGTNSTNNGSNNSGSRVSVTYSAGPLTLAAANFLNHTSGNIGSRGNVGGLTYKIGSTITLKVLGASEMSSTFTSLTTGGVGGTYALSAKTVFDLGVYQVSDSKTNYKMGTMAAGVQQELFKDLKIYGQFASTTDHSGTGVTVGGNYNFTSYISPQTSSTTGAAYTGPYALTSGQTAQTINIGLLYGFF
jgi:hypothetical protein